MPTKQVTISISSIGTDAGPFTITDDVIGTLATGVSRLDLLGGYIVNADETATEVTVTSTGETCATSLVIDITYVVCQTPPPTPGPPAPTPPTPPPTPPPPPSYFYYSVKKYDCTGCTYISPDLVARSSTSRSTIDGVYYNIGGAYVYQIQTQITPDPLTYDISLDGATSNADCDLACGDSTYTAATGVYGSMEPCIGGTIDDFMGAQVYVTDPVIADTDFGVDVYWTSPGASCTSTSTQSFTVTILAGQTSSYFSACSNGAYFPSGATICGACVTSCSDAGVDISAVAC